MKRQVWTPAPIAIVEKTLFSRGEIEAFEREILSNSRASETDASKFFARHPKFLHLGQGVELRREVVLTGKEEQKVQRVDFFRRSYGRPFWDLVELKDPKHPFVVHADGLHPRLNVEVDKAINQAMDYRDLLVGDSEARQILKSKGILVCRPQILVVVGNHSDELSPEILEALYDRVRQRGPLDAMSYSDIYDFAKEHYAHNHLITVPGVHLSTDEGLATDIRYDDLLFNLAADPTLVYRLHPSEFETLIAHLLESFGYEVLLTSLRSDRGIDIEAVQTDVAQTRLLVQCKRYSPEYKIGVQHIREMIGTVLQHQYTKGMLVTTSRFSIGAQELLRNEQWRVEGKDFDDLVRWIDRYHQLARGRGGAVP